MNKKMLESMKNMSREERLDFLKAHKSEFLESVLETVNGGAVNGGRTNENPNSDIVPYKDRWISSWGYICDGEVVCC